MNTIVVNEAFFFVCILGSDRDRKLITFSCQGLYYAQRSAVKTIRLGYWITGVRPLHCSREDVNFYLIR